MNKEEIYAALYSLPDDPSYSDQESDEGDDFDNDVSTTSSVTGIEVSNAPNEEGTVISFSSCDNEACPSVSSTHSDIISFDESVTASDLSTIIDSGIKTSVGTPSLDSVQLDSLYEPSTSGYCSIPSAVNENVVISIDDSVTAGDLSAIGTRHNTVIATATLDAVQEGSLPEATISGSCNNSTNDVPVIDHTFNNPSVDHTFDYLSSSDSEWEEDITDVEDLKMYFNRLNDSILYNMAPEINHNCSKTDKEIDYFKKLFSDEISDIICNETILYANQCNSKYWSDISVQELNAFIVMYIIMGIHVMPSAIHYWSSDPILKVPAIANIMPCKRYKKIIQNLHCNNNENAPKKDDINYDKLFKLRPIIDILNKTCLELYKPSGTMAVDESMVPFKGRTTLKQYMPMKPVKRGYKIWCLADSQTGDISQFDVYTGKNYGMTSEFKTFSMCEKVVLSLSKPFFQTNRLIAFDNFFTTYKLIRTMKAKGLYSCGTVRPNRTGLPKLFKTKVALKRGDHLFATKSHVTAVRWHDNKYVHMLSSGHGPHQVTSVKRKQKDGEKLDITCPEVVRTYNNIMGGVDRFDQLKEQYMIGRRSRKWWHRLFYFLVELAIVNSYCVYKLKRGTIDQLTFRIRLARQLLCGFSAKKRKGAAPVFPNKKLGHIGVPDELRLQKVGSHIPVSGTTRRRCRYRSTKHEEKRTKIICAACKVPVCAVPCFAKFHGQNDKLSNT